MQLATERSKHKKNIDVLKHIFIKNLTFKKLLNSLLH